MTSINSSIEALFNKLENFVSSKTVVGEPITFGDIIIIPLVDVSFGVGAGSSDSREDKNGKNASMGGIGAKIEPSSILVINNGNVQMVSLTDTNSVNKIIDMVPGLMSKLNIFNKKDSTEAAAEDILETPSEEA